MPGIRAGMVRLAARRMAFDGETVTYERAATPRATALTLTAIRGRTPFRTDPVGDGRIQIVRSDADWMVYPSDLLDAAGDEFEPARGDRITDADGKVFELVPLNGEPAHRSTTQYGEMFRLHTMRKE